MNFMLCSSFFKTNCWGKQSVSQPCHPSVSKPFLNGNPLLSLCLFSCQPVNKFFRMLNVNLEMLFLTESILKQMFQKTLPLTVCGAFWYCLLIFNFLKKKKYHLWPTHYIDSMTHEDSWNGDLKTTALNSPKRDHRFFILKCMWNIWQGLNMERVGRRVLSKYDKQLSMFLGS